MRLFNLKVGRGLAEKVAFARDPAELTGSGQGGEQASEWPRQP